MANTTIDEKTLASPMPATAQVMVQDSVSKATSKVLLRRQGYEDLKPTGGRSAGKQTSPVDTIFTPTGLLPAFRNGNADSASFIFHLPHDFVPGSDIYFHVHWSNALAGSGNVLWNIHWCYARGYDLGNFNNEITTQIVAPTSAEVMPHHIDESVAITQAAVTAQWNQELQIDGIIIATLERDSLDALDTSPDDAFFLEFDIHYLSDNNKTVDRNETGSGFTKA